MKVTVYHCDATTGAERPGETCELLDVFGDGREDPEYRPAVAELTKTGRYWLGGGAAPLVLLMRVER